MEVIPFPADLDMSRYVPAVIVAYGSSQNRTAFLYRVDCVGLVGAEVTRGFVVRVVIEGEQDMARLNWVSLLHVILDAGKEQPQYLLLPNKEIVECAVHLELGDSQKVPRFAH